MQLPKHTRKWRVTLVAAVALLVLAGLGFSGCENNLLTKILEVRATAESPIIGIRIDGGAAITNGGAYDFGEVGISDVKDLVLVVTNSGKSDLLMPAGSFAVSGNDAGCFSFPVAPPASLPPSASAKFSIRFCPGTVGAKAGKVVVSTNDVVTPSISVNMTGKGSAQVASPVFTKGSYLCYPSGIASAVTITCPDNAATLYYTTDGSVPIVSSASTRIYSAPFNFSFSGTAYIRAIAVAPGKSDSIVVTATYSTTKIETPVISLADRTFVPEDDINTLANNIVISISTTTTNAKILFTISGASGPAEGSGPSASLVANDKDPVSNNTLTYLMVNGQSFTYNAPHVGGTFVLTAKGYVDGAPLSPAVTATYTFKLSKPAFTGSWLPQTSFYGLTSGLASQVQAQLLVSALTAAYASTCEIRYTTDNTAASATSSVYAAVLPIPAGPEGGSTTEVIRAISHDPSGNWQDSDELTGTFNVCGPGKWDSSLWDQAVWQ
mgnify:CR=1 FL=1